MAQRPSEATTPEAAEMAGRLARDPADDEAYLYLHALHRANGDFAALIDLVAEQRGDTRAACQLFEQEITAESDPRRRMQLLLDVAARYEELQDEDAAVSALERARALTPADPKLAHALAGALVRRSTQREGPTRALDLDRVADLLCDVASALEAAEALPFLRSALSHAPWHARALYELERVTPSSAQGALAAHWVAYLAHNPDGDLANRRRIALARAYLDAGQREDAVFALEPAANDRDAEAIALLAELRPQPSAANTVELTPQPSAANAIEPHLQPSAADAFEPDLQPTAASTAELPATAPALPLPVRDELATFELGDSELLQESEYVAAEPSAELLAAAGEETTPGTPEIPTPPRSQPPPKPSRSRDLEREHPPLSASRSAEIEEAADNGAPLSDSELAQLREELQATAARGEHTAAAVLAERLLRQYPSDAEAFDIAERHYRRNREFGARAELLLRSARSADLDLTTRKQRLRDAIGLYEQKLGDPAGALNGYRALRQLDPENDEVLRGMARQLERLGRWDALCECLESTLTLQPEPSQRIGILRRLAELHRRERFDRAGAASALLRLIELDHHDRAARVALAEDLTALERWPELAALLRRRADEAGSKSERVALLRQLAALCEGTLNDPEAAFSAYERVLEIAPEDVQALARMEEIDEHGGNHERLLSTLQRRVDRANHAQAANVLVRMATIAESDLRSPERAYEFLHRALTYAPQQVQIVTALANLCERMARYDELHALLRDRIASERQPKLRSELLRRLGRLLSQQLNDREGAAAAFRQLNEPGDDLEAWTFLESYARERADRAALGEALHALERLDPDDVRRRARLLERSRLLSELGRDTEAIEPVTRVLLDIAGDDAEAWTRLQGLCAALSDYRSLGRVLEALLTAADAPETRARLAQQLAHLYAHELPDETREQRALQAWTENAPADAAPWRRLAELYERKRRHKELLDALDALAMLEATAEERGVAQLMAAELAAGKLKDPAGAMTRIASYARTQAGPLPEAAIELARKTDGLASLCELCEVTGRYDQLFLLLRERIGKAGLENAAKADLYRRLATGLIEHRQDEEAALAAFEGLLTLGDDSEALRFVQAWAVRHDDAPRLAEALLRLARSEPNPVERRDLWIERGRLLRSRLADPKRAIAAFEEALVIDAECWPALDDLIASSEEAGDHARLGQALERKLESTPADPIALLRQLSALYEGPLGDDAHAIDALRRWADLDDEHPEPLRRLRQKFRRSGRQADLLATLDRLAARERESAARIEATVAAAELAFHEFADDAGAIARLSPLVAAADPEVDRALLSIAEHAKRLPEVYELLERAGRYVDLVTQLDRAATRASDPESRVAWLRRAARILHTQLDDPERAGARYQQLLEIIEDAEALRFIQARALEADDPQALADALLRLSQLEREPRELRDLLYDYARTQRVRLRTPAKAIPSLRRILEELDPDFEPALDELIRAAEAAHDQTAYAFALERGLARESDRGQKAELAERLAGVYLDDLADSASAQRILQIWATSAPDNLTPRRKLRVLYEKHGEHAALLACLDHLAEHAEQRDERHEAALTAAKLCAGPLQDSAAAFSRLAELMRAGVGRAEDALYALAVESNRLDALCELYERSGRYDEVCELLRSRALAEPDLQLRAELLMRCARVLADTIEDTFAAAEVYREVLTLREDPEALRYVHAVAERQDDVPTLADVLARLVPLTEAPERARLSLAQALLLRDRQGQAERACQLLRQLLAANEIALEDPLHARVVEELRETAERIEDKPALAIALEAELRMTRNGSARRGLALQLADLYEGPLDDPDRACEALRAACSSDPRHIGARRRLAVHLARQEAFSEYANLLDTLSHLEPNPAERREARITAARTAHAHLSDSASALTRLAPLVLAGDAEAEELAQSVAREGGLGRELVNLYVTRAQKARTPEQAEQSWRFVMHIQEHWLSDPAEALEAAVRLLAADSQRREYLDEVDRLSVAVGALPRLSHLYAKLVRAAGGDKQRLELCERLSRLLETHGSDPGKALEWALQAARIAPTEARLIDRVAHLAAKTGSHIDLFWAQEQRALQARDPSIAVPAWIAAARTADLTLDDREQANACLRRALALTEHESQMARALEETAAELDVARPEVGHEDARRALLRAHLELAERATSEFQTELILRAARFARDVLQDESGGFDVLRGGAGRPPFADALLDALEETAVRIGRLDALDAQLARSIERSDGVPDKLRLLARRARVLTERLGRFDQAAQVYERLLELAPSDTEAAEHWFICLRRAGRHRELLRACERRLLHVQDPQHKLPFMREMATIWEVELKNRASAVAIWKDVRALAPRDEEAAKALERLDASSRI